MHQVIKKPTIQQVAHEFLLPQLNSGHFKDNFADVFTACQ